MDAAAGEEHHVRLLGEHVLVRRDGAVLPVLAGDEGDAQGDAPLPGVGRGTGAAGGREPAAGPEAVPVRAVRTQAAHVHVDAVAEFGPGQGEAAAGDPPEPLVLGHFPLHRERGVGHAAAG